MRHIDIKSNYSILSGFWILAISLTTLFVVLPASAQPGCFTSIPDGERVKLKNDVGPCPGIEEECVISLGNHAVLDLNGHTVTCGKNESGERQGCGIFLFGSDTKVINGNVRTCLYGVVDDGVGGHVVSKVNVEDIGLIGFHIQSSNNTLKRNTSNVSSEGDGFVSEAEPGVAGILKNTGNIFSNNTAIGGKTGFKDIESDGGRYKNNTSSGSSEAGFANIGSTNLIYKGNAVEDCVAGSYGFDLVGNDNRYRKNRVDGCEKGFFVDGDMNIIKANTANNNNIGLEVGGANNSIRANTATNNDALDLRDADANCGSNRWRNNTFAVSEAGDEANPDCIK